MIYWVVCMHALLNSANITLHAPSNVQFFSWATQTNRSVMPIQNATSEKKSEYSS